MGAEGAIAITAGILAGSIALIGFGSDSAIEGVASLVIVWRFTGHRLLSHAAEERAQKLVAIQFFLLAPTLRSRRSGIWSVQSIPPSACSGWPSPRPASSACRSSGSRSSSLRRRSARRRHAEGAPEPDLRLPRQRGLPRAGGQRPVQLVVARPVRGARDRWRRGQGGAPRPGAGKVAAPPGGHAGGRLRGRLLRVAPVV
jgi:hypothetical protein